MKKFRKILSVVLTLVMVLAMAAPGFAGTGTNEQDNGTIEISDTNLGETYKIYKIFDLESFSFPDVDEEGNPIESESGNYSYYITSNSAWYGFVSTGGAGASYISLTPAGEIGGASKYYVTWKEAAGTAEQFAKLALQYAETETNNVSDNGSRKSQVDGEILTFSNLDLGYYLVDSSTGALCSLDTTNLVAEIDEKNNEPTVAKEVKEDADGNWGESNTAEIGDTVYFKITIKAQPGAQNYVLHDQMSDGLTLKQDTITVKDASGDSLVLGRDYTLPSNLTDGCDFEINFVQTYLDSITASDTIITVEYSATLNGNAVISGGSSSNTNKTKLSYGDGSETVEDQTNTSTFSFDLVKTDNANKLLANAEFELYDQQVNGNKILLVKTDAYTYRLATPEEIGATGFKSAVIVTNDISKITVNGLDTNTTYWLDETKAPEGYNELNGRVEVKMENQNLSTSMGGTLWEDGDGGIHVINKTGALLPSTGGIGTTIFYAAGIVLMAGAVFFVVRRKRA